MEQHVREGLRRDALAVDLDDVPRADDRIQFATRSVDEDPPGDDELVRAPARRDSGAGEERVQTLDSRILPRATRAGRAP